MKKFIRLLLSVVICLNVALGVAACTKDPDDGKTKIKFYFYEAGYGDSWAEALAAKYNAEQDSVKIVPYGDYDMFALAKNEINRGTDLADIYTLTDVKELSRSGKLADLSDMYDMPIETVAGTEYKLNDIVDEYAKDAATVNNVTYGVPWFGTNMGIVYNAGMFANNEWAVPTTMTEFFNLCVQIRAKGIDPLVFCGSTDQGYIPALLDTWLWQAEGDENMSSFLKFDNAEVFQKQEQSRTKIYQQIARMVKDPVVYKSGSNAYNNQHAQREFILGNAAMIVNGAWIANEMESLLKDYPSFRMAIMPIPHINDDKKGADGTDTSNISVKSSNQFVIPENAPNKEEAKKFLLWMSKQENLQLFAENCSGTVRPYKIINKNTDKLNEFGKSVYEMATSSRTVVYKSDAAIYKSGKLGLFVSASGEYVTHLSNQASLQDALNKARELAIQDYTNSKNTFDTWRP